MQENYSIIEKLFENYEPITRFEDADIHLTTGEIITKVFEHSGEELTPGSVYSEMTKLGFFYSETSPLRLAWLLKEKQPL